MKIFLVSAAVIFLILLGLILWKRHTPTAPEAPIQNIATTTIPNITVNPIQPEVSVSAATTSFFTLISSPQKVNPGSVIKTGSSGRALVDSSSAHRTVIDYNSEVVIKDDSEDSKSTRIALVTGAVWARLEKVFDSGEYYEIKTSNAVATVRGTSFGVWYSNHTTTIVVTSGSIFVSAVDEKTGETIPGTEVVVEAGNKAIITADGKITVSPITSADKSSAWYIYNNPTGTISGSKPVSTPTPSSYQTPSTPQPTYVTPTTQTNTTTITPAPAPAPSFSITSLTPSTIAADPGASVTVKGDGFNRLKSVVIGKYSISNYTIVSPTSLRIPVDQISPGTYYISLIDLSNNVVQSTSQITITASTYPTPQSYITPTTYQPLQ